MIQTFYFIAVPYLALIVMIAGTIINYRKSIGSYQFSALSSQFLETKKLFWGSVPFHVGIVILFFGHLIGFLVPKAVLLWNGEPLRLLILEVTAFAFGLCALTGLVLLIVRRLNSPKLKIVTSKMDVFLYLVLALQIITGLLIAYFHRWGSSWFAASIAPYLWSIFKFSPDIEAINQMPFLVKLHVSSAFIIILAIPFSRFRHFLVFPLDYLFRRYQLVIWNRDLKKMKASKAIREGAAPKNN